MGAEQKRLQMEEEMRKKREEDERRRLEQHAALVARKAIQKVRGATPENFDEFKQEVDDTLAQELPRCGTQADRIREEAEKQVEQTRLRIEGIKEQRRREEERKAEEEKLQKEQEETAKSLLNQITALVDTAEKDSNRLKEAALPFSGETELGAAEATSAGKAVSEIGAEVKASCKACT